MKSFYRPRSNPDGWSLNAHCLDKADDLDIRIEAFDGRNWEAHAGALAHSLREALQVRACQCSFCRRHGAKTVSDPNGRLTLTARRWPIS